jgi:integrase/recombinase XerD
LSFEAQEMKNSVPFEFPWPSNLLDNLKHYLEIERPVLSSQRSRWTRDIGKRLWVSSHGSPMTQPAIYDRIVRLTKQHFGKPLNPHLFRDCCATDVAIYDPSAVGICGPILSHKSFQTTERYYLRARQAKAIGRFQQSLLKRRPKS